MLLAGKVACTGIAFILLALGTSARRPTPLLPRAVLSKEAPWAMRRNDVIDLQQTLQDQGHYRGKVDGVFGLRTRASIRAYQKAENLSVTGQIDCQTAGKLGIPEEVRDETDYETPQCKPSAGVKWANGSGRKSKQPRKSVERWALSVPPE